MKTRSQTLSTKEFIITQKCCLPYNISPSTPPSIEKNDVKIDFDDASIQWNKNKKKLGNGMYAYKKSHYKI